jgi:outer membrane PBP1 activator LpoA protein
MPWMLAQKGRVAELRQSLQGEWPHVGTDLDRLYALGMDSYAILPHLNRISAENAARFAGVTSGLSLDRDGRLHRQLAWARFRNGVPRLLDGY